MILLAFWLLLYFIIFLRYRENSIFYIPIIIVLNKISRELISVSAPIEESGFVIMEYSMMIFSIFVSFIYLHKRKFFKFDLISKTIILLVLYLFILSLTTSSDPWVSFKSCFPIVTSLSVFLAFYNSFIIPGEKVIRIVYFQLILFLLIFLGNVVFLTAFNLGGPLIMGKDYGVTSAALFLRMGQFTHFEVHAVAIISPLLLTSMDIYRQGMKSWFSLFMIIIIAILFFLITKRSYLINLGVGIIVYYILYFFYSKYKERSFISLFTIGLLAFLFLGEFYRFYLTARSDALQTEFIMQGRNQEMLLYPEVVKDHENPTKFLLIGEELFNSSGKFKILDLMIGGGAERFLHNDFAHILYGSGIIGLGMYLFILISILLKANKFRKTMINRFDFSLSVSSLMLVIGLMVSGYGDGILSVINRIIPFYFLGVFLSFLRSRQFQNAK